MRVRVLSLLSVLTSALAFVVLTGVVGGAYAGEAEYVLGPGDVIRVSVFQNTDMTVEVRIAESGMARLPLIGTVKLGGLAIPAAESAIESRLQSGHFVQHAQVSILPLQIRGSQVAVLGYVARPGRYPLDTASMRLSDVLATAGGITPTGADDIVLSGKRDGNAMRKKIDVTSLFIEGAIADEIVMPGDVIYVNRAPVFYIYGQVQRPGVLRLERNMSVLQALAAGGGLTTRGTESGLRVHRRDTQGKVRELEVKPDDLLRPDDVIYVKESLF